MLIVSSHRGMGYSKGLVTLLSPWYYTHIRQTNFLISSICSWCGLAAKTIILPHAPSHFSIQLLANNEVIYYIIIVFYVDYI